MKLNLRDIIDGWLNHLIPPARLKELIQQTSDERLAICRQCDFNSEVRKAKGLSYDSWRKDEHCTHCLCPLITKTKALHASCPLTIEKDGVSPKWIAVVTDDESFQINKAIEDDKTDERPDQQTSGGSS